ncbi:PREDICTED: aldehyde oxidase GLOX1-like [Lupinus angustifolius]|uniref:aldehyde oxidase GLOX1-like n=1 Tax=Lupinus angustifolius TaxID=3871 RepID=UPI00092F0837|nr:PREDICTED: aldehyde oxidase GLOX1-like [Lupinus angustifolius]
MTTSLLLLPILLAILTLSLPMLALADNGSWQLLQKSIGIVAMHMQLLHNDRVVIYDRTDFGLSNLSLPNGRCRQNDKELAVKTDCTAHSVEYDVTSNRFRALFIQTNVWCSSGSVSPNGTLVQTGGFNDGERKVRTYSPCSTCDWQELENGLVARRWYATNHKLPDGGQIIIGGRRQFNYEFYPKTEATAKNTYSLPFLVQTSEPRTENNLYPFVFLNVDGNLFIFANNKAILFNYTNNVVVKTFPQIPGGDPRSYPSSGSAVLLPLRNLQGAILEAEVLVCGGAPKGSYEQASKGHFIGALNTCARVKVTDQNPNWVMETMPGGRVMSDMVMLPNGNVLIVNGAGSGTAGWTFGRNPTLNPIIYKTNSPLGSRFELQNPSSIPRMYHSTAVLVRDGRVLVAGSNPNVYYNFTNVIFPTELSVEAFSPSYLEPGFDNLRPRIMSPTSQSQIMYGQILEVQFQVKGTLSQNLVLVTMLSPPFTTHSYSMNQRLLVLEPKSVTNVNGTLYQVVVTTPGSPILAPPGFYLLFVVHQDIPSEGIWVHIH